MGWASLPSAGCTAGAADSSEGGGARGASKGAEVSAALPPPCCAGKPMQVLLDVAGVGYALGAVLVQVGARACSTYSRRCRC